MDGVLDKGGKGTSGRIKTNTHIICRGRANLNSVNLLPKRWGDFEEASSYRIWNNGNQVD